MPLTDAEMELMASLQASGETLYDDRGVSQRDQVDAVQRICEVNLGPEANEMSLFAFVKRIVDRWSGQHGFRVFPNWEQDGTKEWLLEAMNIWCPRERYRFMIISASGTPWRVDEVEATAEGKGRVKVSWTDRRAEFGSAQVTIEGGVSYQYRVAGGVWTRTSDPSVLIEGLVPGEVVEVEVRVAYGNPDLGGPVSVAVADKVLVK